MLHRRALFLLSAAVLGGAMAQPAGAQNYPSQPIKIVVPLAPGGVADVVGRAFANKLTEAGHTAIVENKTGAGGAIAADFVAKSAPDGYTIVVGFHATNAILPHLQKLNYDPEKDLIPVTVAAKTANVLIIHPTVPAKSLKELVAYAKSNPGKLTFASQGNGSTGHMIGEQFKEAAGIDIRHIPYKGAAPAAQDLIAGHVSMLFDVLNTAVPQIKSEKVAALAIADSARSPLLPDVPTVVEAGFPELESGPWFGFFVPANTPKPVIDWLHAQAIKAFNSPDVKEQFAKLGLTAMLGTPDATKAFVAGEYKRWGDVVKKAKITLN